MPNGNQNVHLYSFAAKRKDAPGVPHAADSPVNMAHFFPFGENYRDGISLSTGWLAGSLGGAKSIIASQLTGNGLVKVFSGGSALDGGPMMYLHNPTQHGHAAHFRETASFNPFSDPVAHELPPRLRRTVQTSL